MFLDDVEIIRDLDPSLVFDKMAAMGSHVS